MNKSPKIHLRQFANRYLIGKYASVSEIAFTLLLRLTHRRHSDGSGSPFDGDEYAKDRVQRSGIETGWHALVEHWKTHYVTQQQQTVQYETQGLRHTDTEHCAVLGAFGIHC